jgi:AAA+ superfamily predicted ATPase
MDFEAQLRSAFPHVPTPGQELFIRAFARFFVSLQPRCTLLLRGYAGTGKTTSVGAVVRVLAENGTPTVLLAPTGRAAKVMQQYAGGAASTIHRQLYCASRGRDGSVAYGLAPNPWKGAVFLVDEQLRASVVDTTTAEGNAARRVRVRPVGFPVAQGNARVTDTVIVEATARYRGQLVRGAPVRVLVPVVRPASQ